jgi:hypothetical protein
VAANLNLLSQINGTVISGNTFTNSLAAGVYVAAGSGQTGNTVRITGNRFDRNGAQSGGFVDRHGQPVDDGLHIDVPAPASMVVSGNTATNNGRPGTTTGFGIEAVNGVGDGGTANHASGNTAPAQCFGLTCAVP